MGRMQSKLFILGPVLFLSALIITGCGPATAQPTEVVVTIPAEVTPIPEGPEETEFTTAYSAARAHISEHYGEQPPPSGLGWTTEPITLEGPIDSMGYQYTTGDWVVTVTCPIAGPKRVAYRVRVANETTGFRWEGHVDGEGRVSAASEDILVARDAVLAYVREQYGDQAPALELSWMEELTSPELVPGGISYRFTAEDWVLTIDTAVVPPEMRVYRMSVSNPTPGFWWEGRIDAQGHVTEGPEIVLTAHGAALNYVSEHYGEQAPGPDLTWEGGRATPEGLIGGETFQYTADDWVVTITYPVVAPENVVYHIVVANPTTGFQWEGELDAERYLTETAAPEGYSPPEVVLDRTGARDAALSYIYKQYRYPPVESLYWEEERITPGGMVGAETYRYTAFDWVAEISYNVVAPQAMIYQVRVTNPTLGLKWEGEVDAAGQVAEQPAPTGGQPVVAWYGHVVSTPDGAQFDDYLTLVPEGVGEIGLTGADASIEAEIVALRDKEEPGKYAHFWGTLTCDVPDYGGCQLVVSRLRPDGPGPFFAPDPVEGWEGTIYSGPPGPRSGGDDYFALVGDFPVRYGIDSLDPTIAAQLESLSDTQTTIRVWGHVTCPAIDSYGTHIVVTRIEVEGEAPAEDEYERWNTYTSEKFGYTLKYPGDATVMGSDLDESVQFVGPLSDDEHWPWLEVGHLDSDFYHPPTGTDVHQWIADSDISYDEIGPEVEVAGLSTVHLITYKSPMAYANDDYYFIKGDQLFCIMILHTGGQQDWELYNKFLRSFTFP